jgi:prepilin-type N-terminal cleavage/methylation domain-containing protein
MLPKSPVLLPRHSSRGFTLIEILIAVAILSILIAIATISIRNMRPSLDTKQTANKLVTMLWEARSRAVGSNFQCRLDFDVPNGRYRLQRGSQAYNTPSAGWATISGYDWEPLSRGLTMRSGDCTSTNTVNVQYNANGTARLETPDGTNSPNPVTVCIQGENQARTWRITVTPSGAVIIQ